MINQHFVVYKVNHANLHMHKIQGEEGSKPSIFLNNSKVIHFRPLLFCSPRIGALALFKTKQAMESPTTLAVNRIQEYGPYNFTGTLIRPCEISKKGSVEYIIEG